MEEMVSEQDELKCLAGRIANIEEQIVREMMISKLMRIRKETRELGEQVSLLCRLQEAANADIPGGGRGRNELAVEVQELQLTEEDKIHNSQDAQKQAGTRRLGSCGLGKSNCAAGAFTSGHSMSADMIRRYSRQLLVPSFGVSGQEKLSNSSVLLVGVGGLGSPVASYLAASGVGKLGLVDNDVVELSNLHRQIIHTEAFIGQSKVASAASACRGLNSSLQVEEYGSGLNAANAVEIISQYDVVVDATDNLPTRYIISDACVATGKPLVSGAALGLEGQLTVYNHKSGPCYRCLFPIPPPPSTRQRCSDNGVLGVVPGIIGTFQALEAVKLACGIGETLNSRMLLLDALSTRIHMVKLRGRNPECIMCGGASQISASNLHDYDYERFTQSTLSEEEPKAQTLIAADDRISVQELKQCLESAKAYLLLDVRDPHEFAISSLPNSLNIPLSSLKDKLSVLQSALESIVLVSDNAVERDNEVQDDDGSSGGANGAPVSSHAMPSLFVVCRRGNDSQKAVQLLRSEGIFASVVDVVGGLEAWAKNVDEEFPCY